MPDHDVIDDVLMAADPLHGVTLPDPDGADARALRDRAAGRSRRRRSTRRIALGAAVAAVLGATGATVAFGGGDGRAVTSDQLVCVESDARDLVMVFDARTDDPVAACTAEWASTFGVPVPAELTACVDDSEQGSIEVRPGPVGICAERGEVPYTGPTNEQLRYAAFREEAEALRELAEAQGVTCPSLDDVRAAVDSLLAKHQLAGWSYSTAGVPPPHAACAEVLAFIEPKKLIVVQMFRER
jgi:hypothetical protein